MTPAVRKLSRIAALERIFDDPAVVELVEDVYELGIAQGKLIGGDEVMRRLGASCPKPDELPAWAADGFQPEGTR